MVEEIELKYKEAALCNTDFLLLNANDTMCNLPYNLRGQIITNVIKSLFTDYNVTEEVILSSTLPTTLDNAINFEDINASDITEFLAVNFVDF